MVAEKIKLKTCIKCIINSYNTCHRNNRFILYGQRASYLILSIGICSKNDKKKTLGILIMILIDAFVIVILLPVSMLEIVIGFEFKNIAFILIILTIGKILGLLLCYVITTMLLRKLITKKIE